MAERVKSVREPARRIGVSHVAILKAERVERISREADGSWDVERVRHELIASAAPGRSPLAAPAETTALGRLTIARLALSVEAQRLALDRDKGRLMDIATANQRIDEAAAGMRDAVLNWPARVALQQQTETTMTDRAARNQKNSLAAFLAKKTEFDALLAELTQASEDHFGADPEAVVWGETAWLSDATAKLKDIADAHFRRGEYAA